MEEEQQPNTGFDPLFVRNMLESFLRIGLVFLLLLWTYDIIKPFMVPILWGSIIAMAAYPLVTWLEPKLGGKRGLTCTVVTLFFIIALVVPTYVLTDSVLGGIKNLHNGIESGELKVPAPSEKVAEWPVIGERTYALWSEASRDLESTIEKRGDGVAIVRMDIPGEPMKYPTKVCAGRSNSSCGVRICTTRPSYITTTLSAKVSASVWSWVT